MKDKRFRYDEITEKLFKIRLQKGWRQVVHPRHQTPQVQKVVNPEKGVRR